MTSKNDVINSDFQNTFRVCSYSSYDNPLKKWRHLRGFNTSNRKNVFVWKNRENIGKRAHWKTHVLRKRLLYSIHMSGENLLPMAQTLIRYTSRNTKFENSHAYLEWKKMNLKILSFFLKHPVYISIWRSDYFSHNISHENIRYRVVIQFR